MKPSAPDYYLPDPEYLRLLCRAAGLSPRQAANDLGISERSMRYFLTPAAPGADFRVAPYPVQFALEALACTNVALIGSASMGKDQGARLAKASDVIAYLIAKIENELLAPPVSDVEGAINRASRVVLLSMSARRLVHQMDKAGYFPPRLRDDLLEAISTAENLRRERLPQ